MVQIQESARRSKQLLQKSAKCELKLQIYHFHTPNMEYLSTILSVQLRQHLILPDMTESAMDHSRTLLEISQKIDPKVSVMRYNVDPLLGHMYSHQDFTMRITKKLQQCENSSVKILQMRSLRQMLSSHQQLQRLHGKQDQKDQIRLLSTLRIYSHFQLRWPEFLASLFLLDMHHQKMIVLSIFQLVCRFLVQFSEKRRY